MAVVKKSPVKEKNISTPQKPENNKSKDYIELRIPRFTFTRLPLFLVFVLIIAAFLLGMFGKDLFSGMSKTPQAVVATDIPSAFTGYAKQIGLNEEKFSECYASGKKDKIDEDANTAIQIGVNATPTFYINGQPIVGALPFDVFKSMIEHELTGSPLPTLAPGQPTPAPKQDVAIGHLPILGNKDAAVTVIEFSDFQCPFCDQFVKNTYPQLKKEYIDTGKIAFAYRHFPLTSIHPNATPAAIASECANEQGKFWEYHDTLFQNQATWANLPLVAPTQ